MNDPREIWRTQPTEPTETKPGAQRLRQRAEDLRSRSRHESRNSIVLGVLLAAASIWGSLWTEFPVARVCFAVAAAWALIGQFFLHRAKSQTSPPDDVGLRTSLDACRRELERHIRFDRGALWWIQGPLLLGFGALLGAFLFAVGGKGALVKMVAPAMVLLVAWAFAMVIFRLSQDRQYRRAIEELDQMARER